MGMSIIITQSSYGICNNYYQSSGPSSTKRPFDICYHSEVDNDLKTSSYKYYCIESTPAQYGNNSVGGYTAFREDFDTIDCSGTANLKRIVSKPYRILCAAPEDAKCEILRIRQYPIINASSCTYNASVYAEDIEVIAICDDNGATSEAVFCNKQNSVNSDGSYFWTNIYFNGQCEKERLFEASYQFHGCQGDGSTYLEILGCDFNFGGITNDVKPFDDGIFVAGFVLLLIAILCIVFILIWYCCWFRKGFNGSRKKGGHVPSTSRHFEDDPDPLNKDECTEINQTNSTIQTR